LEDDGLFALSPAFEYLVAPHFSVGGVLDLWFGEHSNIDIFYFGLTAHGRWYYKPALDGFFLDAGLGFNAFSIDGKAADRDHGGFSGLTASLKAGYKLIFGKNFFVEPSMAYVYSKWKDLDFITPLEWEPGLIIGGTF
jgi:outer membrane autotransporter protein